MSNHPKSIPKSSARLFQSIINQCWDDVILQVTDYPEITKRWVVFPQEENIGHSCPHASSVPGRRLPLHEALIHKAPHNVIACLLRACPEAAKEPDDNGQLPLQYAAYYGTTADCMMDLLLAFPQALEVVDHKHQDALSLARHFKNSNTSSTMESPSSKGTLYYCAVPMEHKPERGIVSCQQNQQQYIEELEQQINSLTKQHNDVCSYNKDQATMITDLLQQLTAVTNKYDELFAAHIHVQRAKKSVTRQVEQLLSEKRLLEAKVSIEHESAIRTLEEMHVKLGQFAIKYWECSRDTSSPERVEFCEDALAELLKVSPKMKSMYAAHRNSLTKTSHHVTELEQQVATLVQQIEDFFSSDTIKIQPYEYTDNTGGIRQSSIEHKITSEMEKSQGNNEEKGETLVAGNRAGGSQISNVETQCSNQLSTINAHVNQLSECATDLNIFINAENEFLGEGCRNSGNEKTRISYLEEQITSFINKCHELFQENALKSQAYKDAAKEVERLEADKKSALNSLDEAARKISLLEAQVASLERQNNEISLRCAEKMQECKEAFAQLESVSADKDKIKEENNLVIYELKERNDKLSKMSDELLSENQVKSLAYDKASAQLERLTNERNVLIKRIGIARNQIAYLQSHVRESLQKMDESIPTGEEYFFFSKAEETKGILDEATQLDKNRMKQEARDEEEATNQINVTYSQSLNTSEISLKPSAEKVAYVQLKNQSSPNKTLRIETVDVNAPKDDHCKNSGHQNAVIALDAVAEFSGKETPRETIRETTEKSSPGEESCKIINVFKPKDATYQITSQQNETFRFANKVEELPHLDAPLKYFPVDTSEVLRSNIDLECQISKLIKDVEALLFHARSKSQAFNSVNLLVNYLSAEKDFHIKNSKDALNRCAFLEEKLTVLVQNNTELLVENNIKVQECKEAVMQLEMVTAKARLVGEEEREEATLGISELGGQIGSLHRLVETLLNVATTANETSKEDKRKWKEIHSQMRSMENYFEENRNNHSLQIQNLLHEITKKNSEAVSKTADTEHIRIEYSNTKKLLKILTEEKAKTEKQNAKLIEKLESVISWIDSLLKNVSDSKDAKKLLLADNDLLHKEVASAQKHLLTCRDEMDKSRKEIFDLLARNLSISSESQLLLGELKSIVDSKAGISELEMQLRTTNELLERSLEGKTVMEHKLEMLLPFDTCSLLEQVVQTKTSNASLATELERLQTELKIAQTQSSIDLSTTAAHALKYYEKTFCAMRELQSQMGENHKVRSRIEESSSSPSVMDFLRWKGYNAVGMLVDAAKAARRFISSHREVGIHFGWLLILVFVFLTWAGKAILTLVIE